MPDPEPSGDELIEALLRWERSGAVWRLVDSGTSQATVALLRCDGGEEVDRITSADPDWVAYLAARPRSDA